jgi:thiol-disulfide isomerase/thioredoxin
MTERILLTLILVLLGLLAYWGLRRWVLHRQRRWALGLTRFKPGRPAILHFTTLGCVPCKTIQRPAIENVVEEY